MATLRTLRAAIGDTLRDNLTGIEVYDTVPDVAHLPAVVVVPAEADFTFAMQRGVDREEFDLFVLCSRAVTDEGQNALDDFVAGSGTSSIRQVIYQNPTLGLASTDAHVSGRFEYGAQYETNSTPHVGARLRLIVQTSGTA